MTIIEFADDEVKELLNRAVTALNGPFAPDEVRTWLINATRLLEDIHEEDVAPEEAPTSGSEAAEFTELQEAAVVEHAWEGPITYEGLATGDKRIFSEGAVVWNENLLPFPYKWQRVSASGHDSSITIGRVDRIFRGESGAILAEGVILTGPGTPSEGAEYLTLLQAGAVGGVSIDGDDAEFEVVETPGTGDAENPGELFMVFSCINIRALTAVDIPAFAGARVRLKEVGFFAAVVGATNLPVADSSRDWDGVAAQRALFADAKTENGLDTARLERAFLWVDSTTGPVDESSFKLPYTELIDGVLTIVPKAVFAIAVAINTVDIPEADKSELRRKLGVLYQLINPAPDLAPEFFREDRPRDTASELEAVLASVIPCDPPAEWFNDPKFSELTPVTITDDGQISGHLAGLSCHIGYGSCTTPPRDCDYDAYFHLGALKTAEGETVHVGHMTFGGGHAPTNLSARDAAACYDNTSKVSADIRCGEDEFGTWVVGALRPGLSDIQLREVRSATLSGDWRVLLGKHQLIAAHAVNVPGFPVPRVKALVAAGGETQTLIIASPEECECTDWNQLLLEMELEEDEE